MKKTPPFSLVGSTQTDANIPPAPADLNEHGATLWRKIMARHHVDDVAGQTMLHLICMAADRADDCARAIDRDGAVVRTQGGSIKQHPLLRHELNERAFVVRGLHRLGLDSEPLKPIGRPLSGGVGWRGTE